MTEGFVFWRRCYQEIPLPPGGAYLGLCCEKLWRLFTAVNKKLIVYKIAYKKKIHWTLFQFKKFNNTFYFIY